MKVRYAVTLAASLGVIAIAVWNSSSPPELRGQPDPALAHLNRTQAGLSIEFRSSYFDYKGEYLHAIIGGAQNRETVVFLHGFPSFWYSFARQINALKHRYHIVAIDGLGAGRSSAPESIDNYRQEAMSEHILNLLDSLGKQRFHLVGHDWGSALALGFAQRHPDRVLSVVGISGPPQNILLDMVQNDPEQRERFSYVSTLKRANPLLLALFGAPQKIVSGAYQPLQENGHMTSDESELFRTATSDVRRINRHINWYRANLPEVATIGTADYWPSQVTNFEMPVLLILGDEDQTFSNTYLDIIEAAGNKVSRITYEGVGHWPHFERADQTNEGILNFLRQQKTKPNRDNKPAGE